MDEEKKQKLRQLLDDAIADLRVEVSRAGVREQSMESVDDYILWVKNAWYNFQSDRLKYKFKIDIKNESTKSQLLDFITSEIGRFIKARGIDTAFFLQGGEDVDPEKGYPVEDLLWQLLRVAIVHGLEKAVSDFDRYASHNHVHVYEKAILEGIRLERQIQIDDRVRLVPLPDSVSDLRDCLPEVTRHPIFDQSPEYFCGKALLIVRFLLSPAFFAPSEQQREKIRKSDRLMDIKGGLDKCVHALSLACNRPVEISTYWPSWPKDELFNLAPYTSSSFSCIVNRCSPSLDPTKIGNTVIHEFARMYKVMDRNSELGAKLRVPISRWLASMTPAYSDDVLADQLIDLGIALETLYLSDIRDKGELSFRLCVNASWYLGEDVEARKRLMTIMKNVYDYRSRAVHSGAVPTNIKIGGKEIKMYQLIRQAQVLCRMSIVKIINDGRFPNWKNLVLGDEG